MKLTRRQLAAALVSATAAGRAAARNPPPLPRTI